MTKYSLAGGQQAEDKFFSQEPEFIKAYTFDREAMTNFEVELTKNNECCLLLHPVMLCCVVACFPCFAYRRCVLEDNVRDKVYATHVAITRDGVKFVVDRHKTGCRLDCEDQGKISKTVAFSKITDADLEEPAGKSGPCCCMIDNVLTKVNVDTASSGQFKADVWSMIRGDGVNGVSSAQAVSAIPVMERGGGKSVMERMDELEKLKAKGYINQNEYDSKRKEILSDA
ncbi:hypothetical protein TrST_g9297 [Triparma strigata]|uniref:SHOCT domain-containing protein n=1 Tax=Triparma strigata TaxID=1606541 RepID=A0A9W7BW58_9STRA|nr:hypothetical protein TrST_g9297 [Triparma strigata]